MARREIRRIPSAGCNGCRNNARRLFSRKLPFSTVFCVVNDSSVAALRTGALIDLKQALTPFQARYQGSTCRPVAHHGRGTSEPRPASELCASTNSRIRRASAFRWPWLFIGSLPPDDSIRMSAQIKPVVICTEATFGNTMLISSTRNHDRFRRKIALSVTSITVGNNRLPCVHRLALKISDAIV
jgi:hypothetical protein